MEALFSGLEIMVAWRLYTIVPSGQNQLYLKQRVINSDNLANFGYSARIEAVRFIGNINCDISNNAEFRKEC